MQESENFRSSTPLSALKMVPVEQLQQLASTLPPSQTILKCNQCDHLTESKNEMERHFDQQHPNNSDCNALVLPSMAALMAAAQMNYQQHDSKMDSSIKNEMDTMSIDDDSKSMAGEDLGDKMLDSSDKMKGNCETDVMTIEPDIDGVMINNSSRSSSAVSMLHPDDVDDKISSSGAMRTTPQNQQMQKSHQQASSPFSTSSAADDYSVMCPLCQESFTDRKSLEQHVMCIHSVNADGLNRLLQLVDTSHWLNNKKSPERSTSAGGTQSIMSGTEYECLICSDSLKSLNDLLMHASEHQHFNMTGLNQFTCLLKSCNQRFTSESQVQQHFRDSHLNIVISERHVYKYRCKLCSLAFKTQEKLNNHAMYHTMRDATKCNICNRNFRSTTSLQRHIEQVHSLPAQDLNKSTELTDDERIQSPHDDVASNVDSRDDDFQQDDSAGDQDISEFDEYMNSEQMAEEQYTSNRKFKCHKCKMAFTQSVFLNQHYKSQTHRRNDKLTNYPMEKYLDPNRPFKCEICRESFTQKNILLVHYNSVSHLHKLKKQQNDTHSGSSTPALCTSPNQMNDFDRKSVDFDRKSIDYEMEISNSVGETNKRKLSSDNDYDSPKKRFKCDICKVAYAQGSTLDIHMRSVLHQTRSCRLQEQQQKLQAQQAQLQTTSPNLSQSHELFQQQQLPANNGNEISPKLANNQNQMYKTLLENFGFDVVKQFSEINQLNQQDLLTQLASAKIPAINQTPKKNGNAEMESSQKSEKFSCRHCKKVFSSIFVLKNHCEDAHNEKIPVEILEKFAETFKGYNDKEQDNEALDFSQQKPIEPIENLQLTDPMKLFNPDILQKQAEQKLDPAMLAQRLMEQQFLAQFPQITQSLQSLGGGAGMPFNTLEMLNLMQFHQFMSLNFMNLAPPLIFGGAGQQGSNMLSPGGSVSNPVLPTPKTDVTSPASSSISTPSLSMLQQQQQANANQISSQVS